MSAGNVGEKGGMVLLFERKSRLKFEPEPQKGTSEVFDGCGRIVGAAAGRPAGGQAWIYINLTSGFLLMPDRKV